LPAIRDIGIFCRLDQPFTRAAHGWSIFSRLNSVLEGNKGQMDAVASQRLALLAVFVNKGQ